MWVRPGGRVSSASPPAVFEGVVSDVGAAGWEGDLGQPPAAVEGVLSDMGEARREGDLGQPTATKASPPISVVPAGTSSAKARECARLLGQPASRRSNEDRQVGGAHLGE